MDLRFRPMAMQAKPVCHFEAFRKYQLEKAWTWEHQSLTRARFVCGATEVGNGFEEVRHSILTQQRDLTALKPKSSPCAKKMLPTHPPREDTSNTHAERHRRCWNSSLQYLILAHSHIFHN